MPLPSGHLRILHIVLSIGETNAAYNEHCLPLADERDITICTYFGSETTPPTKIRTFKGNGTLIGFFRALRGAMTTGAYDVIHAHSPHVGMLFLAARLMGMVRSAPATVVTVHDSYPNYKLRNRLLFLPVFAGFQSVVCCSRSSMDSFPRAYKWLAGPRLTAVQNGLNIDRIDRFTAETRARPVRDRGFTVIAIARMVTVKNPFAVLAAFGASMDRTSRLVFIGDGPLRASLVTEGQKPKFEDRVEFTGLIPREQVYERVLGADIFVSASRGEGLPVAVMEAMACCRPVVLSDIPPHREIAGGTDFIPLFSPEDTAALAREIDKFRAMPPSERQAVGGRCRKLVEERFSLRSMHAGYADIYSHLVHADPSQSRRASE